MNVPTKTLAALLVAAGIPLLVGQAAAAPLGPSRTLSNVDMSTVEQVQWRRRNWRSGRRAAVIGFGAGVAVGGAYAYGAPVRRYRADPCGGDAEYNSAYPSWQCRPFPRATDWNRW